MKNTKLTQSAILENWYGIDDVLFVDEKHPKDILDEESFDQYVTTKTALLNNLFEIYIKLGYNPERKFNESTEMKEYAQHAAFISRTRAKNIIEEEETMTEIQKEISEICENNGLQENEVSEYIINKKFKAVSIDCLTLGEAISNGCSSCLGDWDGKVMVDSHKTLRDKLVDILFKKVNDEDLNEVSKGAVETA